MNANSPLDRDLVWACQDLDTNADLATAVERVLQALEHHLYEQKEQGAAIALRSATPTIVRVLHRGKQ